MLASARLGERSPAACAVTSWQGRLFLAWTGSDARVNVASSADGAVLEGKLCLGHRTYRTEWDEGSSKTIWLAPALVGAGDALYLAWTGTDGRLNVQGADRAADAEPVRLPKRTSMAGPSVTVFGPDLIVAWTGTDRRANLVAIAGDWSQRHVILDPARSNGAPAVCGDGGELVLAWTGGDDHLNLARLP